MKKDEDKAYSIVVVYVNSLLFDLVRRNEIVAGRLKFRFALDDTEYRYY